jgi:CubicO group peptidase (beta-lactamase class C family)
MERVSAEQLEQWVAEARQRWNVPGIAVGVLRAGEAVAVADGVGSLGGGEAVSPETVFRIASISKPFTAMLAMTLVQDGLLGLDELPPGSPVDATVRQLLSHQGGLACEWPEPIDRFGEGDDALLQLLDGEPEQLPVGPGELYSYSNVGFWLVGAAIAQVCGTSFEEAMRARVLEPLALHATSYEPRGAARGHNQVEPGADDHHAVEDKYPRVRRPCGGLWSSVADLLRFAEHHLGGPGPLSEDSRAQMQSPQIEMGSESYGLGWDLYESRGRQIVEHSGSAAGFQSLLRLVPAEGVAFAGLTNSSRGLAALRDVLERLGLDREEASDVTLTADELASFAGRYEGQGMELSFAPDDGGLRVELALFDPFTGETEQYPSSHARPIGPREFEIVDEEWRGDRFDFPRDGFVNMVTLATRVP